MILFESGGLAVRQLKAEDDVLLCRWLSDPAVLAYYEGRDRPQNLAAIRETFFNRKDEDTTCCIITYDNNDIGYIQFYPIGEDERTEYGYSDFSGNIMGMDQFIGETVYWNRGIGTQLITAMKDFLQNHKHADKIVMDPQVWNHRALRVYEKCGFIRKKLLPKHEWHEGEYRDCWLIEFDCR
ncbi:GNAT family N-acetyltransferase [Paenibacillus nasutitermitis]|uniref:GNAT family N-acetyltransferase n=1 Tax=Paenibacillus nasutitermitis TaxID=1652958 RepID=A0A917DSL8_9BACL|nr:GNAT family N-acetyltransferase [Paenibacillus nasutitermitis]GGD63164.1 GNAT family N-acetyltransferase [Paenibacillus nasutitermitis]